jgi:phosphoribosylanthranilate isomerase
VRTRVKICGITRACDAESAALAGADAIGLVFHAASRRGLDAGRARAVIEGLAPFVSTVALFVDPDASTVREVLERVRPDLLQFHGAEDPAFCAQFGVPYLKAVHLGDGRALDAGAHPEARALLLDTWDPCQAGGTGRAFDWRQAQGQGGRRIVLAGGLHAGNVEEAIATLRPWAVDVSSGVESAPGIKDPRRIAEFMQAVRRADEALAMAEDAS